ncbi:MAG: hypothetical protein ABI947_13055 [Chloroflexota bacterium]
MAPPPNSGDANNKNDDDPLGGLDPMAWLESLAARQGANADELTTKADLDIPVLPEDTVVDIPGYTPGYDVGKSTYTASQAAKPPEKATPTPVTPPVVATPEPAASTAPASDDPFGGMDPMAWLESLAKRQGANTDELTTTADLDIPVLPEDTVVDMPGYTPGYDVGKSTYTASQPTKPPEMATPPPEPMPEPVASTAPAADDPLGGMDPMDWLENLAKQGNEPSYEEYDSSVSVSETELPELDLSETELPVLDLSESATETGSMSAEEAAALLGLEPVGSAEDSSVTDFDFFSSSDSSDPMDWLENLAANQDITFESSDFSTDFSAFDAPSQYTGETMDPQDAMSFLEDLAKAQASETPSYTPDYSSFEEEAATSAAPAELGGMSNDINEVQRWLEAQAQNLEQTRVELETEPDAADLPPAEPASEIPAWLTQSMPPADIAPRQRTPALSNDITLPPVPSELPAWLQSPQPEPLSNFEEDLFQSISEAEPQVAQAIEEPVLTDEELELLTRPSSPAEVDSWAEALDEEYERKSAGDDSVPDWYLEALQRAEPDLPRTGMLPPLEPQAQEAQTQEPEPAVESVGYTGMPDWLSPSESDEPVAEALPGEIPSWLTDMAAAASTPVASTTITPAEPVEVITSAEPVELPDWLRAAAPTPPPIPEPVAEAPLPPMATPVTPPTPVKAPPPVVAQTTPSSAAPEHHARLQKARELVANGEHHASLEHYQALIDSSQLLEESGGDLIKLVEQHPKDPRTRRLLGDTYMRLGDLQTALDTYRSALDQL